VTRKIVVDYYTGDSGIAVFAEGVKPTNCLGGLEKKRLSPDFMLNQALLFIFNQFA